MKKRLSPTERKAELYAWIASGRARGLRISANATQNEGARYCEVTQGAIHRWETAERYPRGRNVIVYHRWLSKLATREAG